MIIIIIGDYPKEFLRAVGWNQHRNPTLENLPPNLSPGSDDELQDLEEAIEQLSVDDGDENEDENEEVRRPNKDPPVNRDPPNIQPYQNHDDDDNMRIDVMVKQNVPDPRGCHGVRTRLCCRALLPSGIKLNTIEVSIDRDKKKVILKADLIEALKYSDSNMIQIRQHDQYSLNTAY